MVDTPRSYRARPKDVCGAARRVPSVGCRAQPGPRRGGSCWRWSWPPGSCSWIPPSSTLRCPTIARDLPATMVGTLEGQAYVTSGYLATLSAFLIIAGALADRYGRRRIFIIGLASFGLTSALCGLAPTMEWLVLFRLAQGAAGALLVPGPLSLITANFEGAARARAFGIVVGRDERADHPRAAVRGHHRRLVLVAARLPRQRAPGAAGALRRHPIRARVPQPGCAPPPRLAGLDRHRHRGRGHHVRAHPGPGAAMDRSGRVHRARHRRRGRDRIPRPDAPAARPARATRALPDPGVRGHQPLHAAHLRSAVHLLVPVQRLPPGRAGLQRPGRGSHQPADGPPADALLDPGRHHRGTHRSVAVPGHRADAHGPRCGLVLAHRRRQHTLDTSTSAPG